MVEGRCEIFQGTGPYRPWMTVDVRDDAACHIGLLESDKVANGERYLAMSTETRSYEDICTSIDRVLPELHHDPGPIVDRSPDRWKEREDEFRSIWGGLQLRNDRIRAAVPIDVPPARRLDPRLCRVAAGDRPHRGAHSGLVTARRAPDLYRDSIAIDGRAPWRQIRRWHELNGRGDEVLHRRVPRPGLRRRHRAACCRLRYDVDHAGQLERRRRRRPGQEPTRCRAAARRGDWRAGLEQLGSTPGRSP